MAMESVSWLFRGDLDKTSLDYFLEFFVHKGNEITIGNMLETFFSKIYNRINPNFVFVKL